jgi:hypothetical protein
VTAGRGGPHDVPRPASIKFLKLAEGRTFQTRVDQTAKSPF